MKDTRIKVRFCCINVGSKNPKRLAEFYKAIGVPVYVHDQNYDGWQLGNEYEGYVCIWDENKWGKSSAGYITIVLRTEDLHKKYEEILENGIKIDPPHTTDWGGQELAFDDPDGNKVIMLL